MLPSTPQDLRRPWRYGLAVAVVLAALAGRLALDPLLGGAEPFMPFLLAVTLVAGIAGTGPGIVSVAASLLAAVFLVPRAPSVSLWLIHTASFLFVSVVTLVMFEIARAARARDAEGAVRLRALGRAEATVRASEARYRALVEATSAFVWHANVLGGTVEAPGWTTLTGLPADLRDKRNWLHAVHPDDRGSVREIWDAARRAERPARAQFRIRISSGAYRWMSLHGIPMRDARGRVREWVGTATDITELKRGEAGRAAVLREAKDARLRASQAAERLRRVQRIVDVMLVDLSLDHLLGKLLPRVATMLEADTAVILLRDGDALTVRAAIGVDDDLLRDLRELRVPLEGGIVGAVARDRRPVVREQADVEDDGACLGRLGARSLVAVPMVLDHRLLGVLHVGTGIPHHFDDDDVELLRLAGERIAVGIELAARRDAERHARAAVESASRAKDDLLAMLAHELRNPLSAVRNAIAVARLAGPRRDAALDIARRQADQLARLVDDLLDVARITRGTIVLRRERVAVADVIERAVDAVSQQAAERGHEIAVRLPETPLDVDGDAVRLVQVMTNVLDNAVKYTDPGGHIAVSASPHGAAAVIRVHDDGTGIPGELAPHVFDLFAQGDRALDRSLGGLGIGLTVVKRLVELHSGRVALHSGGPGAGSEVVIELPALPPAPSSGRERRDVTAAAAPPARLLVVEDNAEAADALGMLLEEHGHEVQIVHDGPAALEAVRSHTPDVAIIDIGLPGMNGYDVARAIRRDRGKDRPALIALTGYGRREDRAQALASGFDDHFVKPVDFQALADVLRAHADPRLRLGSGSARQ